MSERQIKTSIDSVYEHYHLEERIKQLEDAVFKKIKRKQATKSQKLLLFRELGLLDKIGEMGLSQNNRALLVSILVDADEDNVRKDLSQIGLKNSPLNNEPNYKFLIELFDELGLKNQTRLAEKKFLEIQKTKEMNLKKK